MTTNSDGAIQPKPGDQPDPAAAAAAAAAAAEAEPEVIDQDAQEVIDAQAAVEAEKDAAGEGGAPGVDPATGKPIEPKPGEQGKSAGGEPAVMIPKARLDEALHGKSEAEANAAYWKGVADGRATGIQPPPKPGDGQPGGQQQQQPLTADARLATIQAQSDALAAKFDNGEISMADLTKQQRDLANKEAAIREDVLLAKVKPADQKPADQGGDQLYLDSLTAQLEQDYPWVVVFDKVGTESDWNYLKETAKQNLVDRGVDPTQGDLGKYELRKEVARLADKIGPFLIGDKAKAKGIAIPDQTPSPGGQKPTQPLSPQARARAAKLDAVAGAPPNLNAMGGNAGDPSGIPSDARVESMDEEAIGALPDNVRKRLLGTA